MTRILADLKRFALPYTVTLFGLAMIADAIINKTDKLRKGFAFLAANPFSFSAFSIYGILIIMVVALVAIERAAKQKEGGK